MITNARPKDGAGILNISASLKVFSHEEVETVDELWREYQKVGAKASGYQFVVMREKGRVLGYACYGPRALTEGTYDLYWIAVDPNAHRKGAGRKLMEIVEKRIAKKGGRLVFVETSGREDYGPTRKFYRKIGYKREATVKDFYSDGDDLVIYTKKVRQTQQASG